MSRPTSANACTSASHPGSIAVPQSTSVSPSGVSSGYALSDGVIEYGSGSCRIHAPSASRCTRTSLGRPHHARERREARVVGGDHPVKAMRPTAERAGEPGVGRPVVESA